MTDQLIDYIDWPTIDWPTIDWLTIEWLTIDWLTIDWLTIKLLIKDHILSPDIDNDWPMLIYWLTILTDRQLTDWLLNDWLLIDWLLRCSMCQEHHHTGNDQLTYIKTSSSVVEVAKLMAWRQATSPLKIPTWSGGCQLLENVWRRHFTTWSGGNLQRWSRLPPSHQFDYFHHWGWCFYGCQLVIARMVVSLTFGQHLDHPSDELWWRRIVMIKLASCFVL